MQSSNISSIPYRPRVRRVSKAEISQLHGTNTGHAPFILVSFICLSFWRMITFFLCYIFQSRGNWLNSKQNRVSPEIGDGRKWANKPSKVDREQVGYVHILNDFSKTEVYVTNRHLSYGIYILFFLEQKPFVKDYDYWIKTRGSHYFNYFFSFFATIQSRKRVLRCAYLLLFAIIILGLLAAGLGTLLGFVLREWSFSFIYAWFYSYIWKK
jgi:hypothetical protein